MQGAGGNAALGEERKKKEMTIVVTMTRRGFESADSHFFFTNFF
jgi:hypothetical protein